MKLFPVFLFTLLTMASAFVHGTDGDHAHGNAPAGQLQAGTPPRIDASTEAFELVGQLQGNELSILIDRFETNEPVLNGKLDVEFGGLKAPATFRADHGDYVIADTSFVQALAKPGKHALVFTLTTADDSDLLEGTLEVRPSVHVDDHAHFPWRWTAIAAFAALILIVLAVWRRRSQTSTGK